MMETGFEDPGTVLSAYYVEFNQKILQFEKYGKTNTYSNPNNAVPVSNHNDTFSVYMILYADGRASYVVDDNGKQHLREVFDKWHNKIILAFY